MLQLFLFILIVDPDRRDSKSFGVNAPAKSTMPVNAVGSDQLSGIEEESDIYEAFAPHVDTANISVLTDTPPGKCLIWFLKINPVMCLFPAVCTTALG